MTGKKKYARSFTTGGLFRPESARLAALYLELGDWELVRKKTIAENLLQTRTLSSSTRMYREIAARLMTLSARELDFLALATTKEQGYLLWLAICRRYEFLGEFAIEVIRERFLTLKPDLRFEDFDSFFNRKAEGHPEFDSIRPSTRSKLRQVLFRILREADLLSDGNLINGVFLREEFIEAVSDGRRREVPFFPTAGQDSGRSPK
jgi:hypothetical protein